MSTADTSSEMGPRFIDAVPILGGLDEARSRAFYCDFLGFEVDFEFRFEPDQPLYLGLERGPVHLHVDHHGNVPGGSWTFVWLSGIDAYRETLLTRRGGFAVPEIVDQPWGREMKVTDPLGNILRFCEPPGGS